MLIFQHRLSAAYFRTESTAATPDQHRRCVEQTAALLALSAVHECHAFGPSFPCAPRLHRSHVRRQPREVFADIDRQRADARPAARGFHVEHRRAFDCQPLPRRYALTSVVSLMPSSCASFLFVHSRRRSIFSTRSRTWSGESFLGRPTTTTSPPRTTAPQLLRRSSPRRAPCRAPRHRQGRSRYRCGA